MKMDDVQDPADYLTPESAVPEGADEGQKKVLALMEQMQRQAQQGQIENIDQLQETNAQLLNIKSEDTSANFWEVDGLPTK